VVKYRGKKVLRGLGKKCGAYTSNSKKRKSRKCCVKGKKEESLDRRSNLTLLQKRNANCMGGGGFLVENLSPKRGRGQSSHNNLCPDSRVWSA